VQLLHGVDTRDLSQTAPNSSVPRPVQWAVLLGALLLIWHSLGDHALLPPDEGRYGSVSAWMAENGNWLQPKIRDMSHVTKPPLTYWAQALGVLALGRTELAIRLPSALGATITVFALFWFTRRMWGSLAAVLAVGVYAIMPLPLIVGRLATTDSLLNAWWWLALCFGFLALQEPRKTRLGWLAAFWGAVALIGLTKGPLALAPVALLWTWLVCAGRWRDVWRTHAMIGLPLALAPLAVAAYLFWQSDPERTLEVWRREFVDRIAGGDYKREPIWQLAPVLLGGLVPASVVLLFAGLHRPFQRLWATLAEGGAVGLLIIAVVLPFIGFSLLSNNQPTYLLPLAPPCAVLFAVVMAEWFDGRAEWPSSRANPREMRTASGLTAAALVIGVPGAALAVVLMERVPTWAPGWTLFWWSLFMVPAGIGWLLCSSTWVKPATRAIGFACVFVGMVAMWLGVQEVEDMALDHMNSRGIARLLASQDRPVLLVGFKDLTIDFYAGEWHDYVHTSNEMAPWLKAHPNGLVVVGERRGKHEPGVETADLAGLVEVERFDVWPFKQAVVLELRNHAGR
jgi:4-amino-4-deoxy-L-arabinose transferase-like glycosyltransferase